MPQDPRPSAAARYAIGHFAAPGSRPIFIPSGTRGFEDLQTGAIRFEVFGVEILASNLPDIIRSKEAADRPQDRQDVIILREILRRRNARD